MILRATRVALPTLAALVALNCCAANNDDVASCGAKLIFGDLVISEVMGNPGGVDSGQEWLEIYNATAGPVNLKGVKLSSSRLDGSSDKTWRMPDLIIPKDGYVVFGNADDAALPPFVNAGYKGSLSDMVSTGTKFSIKCNSTVVDEVETGATIEAVAWQLSSLNMDASANDKPENWCAASQDVTSPTPEIWQDFKGSPGKANRPCAVEGKCMDGGEARDLVNPKAGDLALNEVMFNPSGTETEQEWIELLAMADVDLNDLELGKVKDGLALPPAFTITSADCLKVKKGDIVVLAREAGKDLNGGLPEGSVAYDGLSMTNSNGNGVWIGVGGVVDQVSWTTSKNGYSYARDPTQKDLWCDAADADHYGWVTDKDGNPELFGTPGEANPPCK